MKVALTVWDGRISPVFDACQEALILEIDGGRVVSTANAALDCAIPQQKIERLVSLGVETLICGAISAPLHTALVSRGVNVIGFIAGEVDEVLQAYLASGLQDPALMMPGCRGRQRRFRGGGRGQGRGRGRGQGGGQGRGQCGGQGGGQGRGQGRGQGGGKGRGSTNR